VWPFKIKDKPKEIPTFEYDIGEESECYILISNCTMRPTLDILDKFLKERGWEFCYTGRNSVWNSYLVFKKTKEIKNERA